MQLYSTIVTHYPASAAAVAAGTSAANGPSVVFKVSPSPEPGGQSPVGVDSDTGGGGGSGGTSSTVGVGASTAMPAFSCLELLPPTGPVQRKQPHQQSSPCYGSGAQMIRRRPLERVVPVRLVPRPEPVVLAGELSSSAPHAHPWLLLENGGGDSIAAAASAQPSLQQEPSNRGLRFSEHCQALQAAAAAGTYPGVAVEAQPAGGGLDYSGCRREAELEAAEEESSCQARPTERSEKLALYLAEVEKQDKYLRHKSRFRFHIIPDGNCLYRAVCKAINGDQRLHGELREQTVHYIADHLDHFSPIIEGDVGEFLINAAQDGAWAGYPELLAMGQMLNVNIHLTTGGRPESPTVSTMAHYLGPEDPSRRSIWLSWLSNGHYDAVLDRQCPNPEYEEWCRQTQVQRRRDEELAKSMAVSLSKMYIEQNACS
ncbi:OTU domain-containing protein 1 [Varanus komodoensis]|uniref:OTU domain-containing protein 1 n=1 Tax=Varanus komodoensis TaxID=61221 RepID=A0A8D2LWM2_VARKO|nr:OTU domain-containing protein 1 [Varanus komodoensis]KAF7245902.1 OTU domain-containing protein 1 [Varanus komodoensis]